MKRQEKQRKSKSVVLCRSSKKDPGIHGKEIQGLVFDHPSMPKIVTVSSAPRKAPSRNPSVDRARGHHPQVQYPTGHGSNEQHTTEHYTPEQRSTGHYTPGQYSSGKHPAAQNPTGHYTPEQYPTGQRPRAQHPTGHYIPNQNSTGYRSPEQSHSRSSPPPLIHTPRQYSTRQQMPGAFRQYHPSLPSGAKPAERVYESLAPEFDSQGERSQVRFPSYYRQASAPPHRGRQFQHQHVANSQVHAETAAIRRNSTGALRDRSINGVQYSGNIGQTSRSIGHHSRNTGQHSERGIIELGTDRFSRDFHLKVWRESHEYAVRNLNPPVRGLPQTSGLIDTSVPSPRYRSSSDDPPRFAYQMEQLNHHVDQKSYPRSHQQVSPTSSNPTPPLSATMQQGQYELRSMRRYISEQPGSLNTEVCTEVWSPRIFNERVRSSERTNSEVSSTGNQRTSGDISEGCSSPVVRTAQGTNSEITNTGIISTGDKIRRRQTPRPTQCKRQQSPTVVVISDSDDEEMEVLSPLSSDDSDVFTVAQETESHNRDIENSRHVRESLSSNLPSDSSGESEAACYITKVKRPDDKNVLLLQSKNKMLTNESQNVKSTGPSKISQDTRAYDVNNNEESNRKEMGTSYRSVLYEREIAGQSGTRSVIMSEQLLFEKEKRGTKRTLRDKADYFVAGPAETAGSALDAMANKIRRVSCDEPKSNARKTRPFSSQSSQDSRHFGHSGENSRPELPTGQEDVPKLVRSRSENDKHIIRENDTIDRSSSPTYDPRLSESQQHKRNVDVTNSDLRKCEELQSNAPKFKQKESHCNVCFDQNISPVRVPGMSPKTGASSATSRDEFRCRSCDRVLTENKRPGNEGSHTMVKLPKAGRKPTGIVVGVKQSPEVRQPPESNNSGSEKTAKDCDLSTNDVICDDQKLSKNGNGDDLDILHFRVVRKDAEVMWTDGKDHVKSTTSPRDQVVPSQQWEAYSLKLEEERKESGEEIEEKTPAQVQEVNKRNSWAEIKQKFEAERTNEKHFTSPDISSEKQRENATRKRAHSHDNVFEISSKSYKFHDTTNSIAEEYKRRKLSEISESDDSTSPESCSNVITLDSQNHDPKTKIIPKNCELLLVTQDKNSRCLISTNYPKSLEEAALEIDALVNTPNIQVIRPSGKKPSKLRPLLVRPPEIEPSEQKSPQEDTLEKDSSEKQPAEVRPSEFEPTGVSSPGKEPEAANSPPQKEELSLKEWIEILQGRIEQVKESIDEEMTPWKTKNKRKVLEKLEHNLAWITGPDVDEAMFISRRLQFFQTMRKQYELMNKIKTQRQAMKTTDTLPQVVENVEDAKVGKEEEVSKETKEIKKTVKCKPKRVKNSRQSLMKKMRKALLS